MLYLQEILGQVVLSFLFIRLTVAAATSDGFLNPPNSTDTIPELTYTRGEVVQLAWQTNLERVALTLWHSLSSQDFEYLGDNNATINISNTDSYRWRVDTKADISENTFSFAIFDPGQNLSTFQSQDFSIIEAPSSTSTVTTVVSTSAPTSTIIISTSTTLITTSTYSVNQGPSTTTATNSGRRQGAKTEMGIGIGVGVGVPVLLAVGIYLGVVG